MRDRLISWVVRAGFALLRLLPLDAASAFGSALARTIGPRLPVHRVADANMARALPALDTTARQTALRGMWDNLGRFAGEFPHLDTLLARAEVVGLEHLHALRDDGRPGLILSGHYGNWELLPRLLAREGLSTQVFYRPANNAHVDALIQDMRGGAHHFTGKGRGGTRAMIGTLRDGGHVTVLFDQKQNDGLAVPLFGRPAMTSPMPAAMARRFACPVVMLRFLRVAGTRFRIEIAPPVELGLEADELAAMTRLHRQLETWIAERPDQWFWVHRRWGKDV